MTSRTTVEVGTRAPSQKLPTESGRRETALAPVPTQTWQMMGDSIDEGLRFAETLLKSGLMPKALNTKEKVFTVLLKGRELGIPPLVAAAKIYVIGGNAIMDSQLMMGICQRQGVRFQWKTEKDREMEEAVLQIIRPDGEVHLETFTYEYAQGITFSEWTGPDGQKRKIQKKLTEKDNWKNSRIEMLRARVVARGIRWFCSDYLVAYTPDEVPEIESEDVEAVISDLTDEHRRQQLEKLDTLSKRPAPLKTDAEVVGTTKTGDDLPVIDRTREPQEEPPDDDDLGETRGTSTRRQEPQPESPSQPAKLGLYDGLIEAAKRAGLWAGAEYPAEIIVDSEISGATGVREGQFAATSFEEGVARQLGTAYKLRAQRKAGR